MRTSTSPSSGPATRLARLRHLAACATGVALIGAAAGVVCSPAAGSLPVETAPAVATVAYTENVASAATNYWGAIAISPRTYDAGYAWDYRSQASASKAAVGRCGVRDCQTVVVVANGCAALTEADNYALGWGYGASRSAAERAALNATHGRHARVVGWLCTANHR